MSDARTLRAVLVDDERLAGVQMRQLLAAHPQVEVVGEADSVAAAAELVRRLQPDVVFLDVQLPGESGFDLLRVIDTPPHIVFVTAFDTYAVKAFEVNALDYLLKPVQPARLATAVARLLQPVENVAAPPRPGGDGPKPPAADDRQPFRPEDLLFLEFRNRPRFVRVSSIRAITAEGPYSMVTVDDGASTLVLRSMREWEERLPQELFLRIHRSAIVNATFVTEIRNVSGYRCEVLLRGAESPLMMSRRHARRLRQRMA